MRVFGIVDPVPRASHRDVKVLVDPVIAVRVHVDGIDLDGQRHRPITVGIPTLLEPPPAEAATRTRGRRPHEDLDLVAAASVGGRHGTDPERPHPLAARTRVSASHRGGGRTGPRS